MIEKIIKYLPITTAIILFLFICGGLYLIGFWSTFGIDFTGLVQITEIPKSFITPFAYSIGVVAIGIFIITIINPKYLYFKQVEKSAEYIMSPSRKGVQFKLDFWVIVISASIFILSIFFHRSILFWRYSGMLFILIMTLKLVSSRRFLLLVGFNKYIIFGLYLMICTLVLSFTMGKTGALFIYLNKDIKYVNNINAHIKSEKFAITDSVRFKFLGFLGEKLIVSSLDNKVIFILNQSSLDVIEIEKSNKNSWQQQFINW